MLSVLNVGVRDAGQDRGSFTLGSGQKVITIGSEAEAAGSVDYTFGAANADVQFQAALNALPATGGRLVVVSAVQINWTALTTVTRAIDNVIIEGSGRGTYFVGDGITPIFAAGGDNWVFTNLRTDAGGINMGATTGWLWTNVQAGAAFFAYCAPGSAGQVGGMTVSALQDTGLTSGRVPYASTGGLLADSAGLTYNVGSTTLTATTVNATTVNSPTGRSATIIVAASDATATEKAQADYVCTGTLDGINSTDSTVLQTAYNLLAAGGSLQALGGTFYVDGTSAVGNPGPGVFLHTSNTVLDGGGASFVGIGTNLNAVFLIWPIGNEVLENITLRNADITAPVSGANGVGIGGGVGAVGSLTNARVEHVVIHDIPLVGGLGGKGISFGAVTTFHVINPVIDNVVIKDCEYSEIDTVHVLSGPASLVGLTISNFYIENLGVAIDKAIWIRDAGGIYITGTKIGPGRINTTKLYGMSIESPGTAVYGVSVYGGARTGINGATGNQDWTDVYADGCGTGAILAGSGSYVQGTFINSTIDFGLYVTGSGNQIKGISSNNTLTGLYVFGGNGNSIEWTANSERQRAVVFKTANYNILKINAVNSSQAGAGSQDVNFGDPYNGDSVCTHNTVTGTFQATAVSKVNFNIRETASGDYNTFTNCIADGGATIAEFQYNGVHDIIRGNIPFVTENSGTVIIYSGTTSNTTAHGLSFTPTNGNIVGVPTTSLGAASYVYVDGLGAANMTWHTNADPTADVTIAWKASRN